MNKDKFLKTVCKQIRFGWDRDIVSKELEFHIEDSVLDLISEGYSKEEANKIAIEQMGNPIEIGKQLNEEHKPLLGWAWLISKIIALLLIIPSLLFIQKIGEDVYHYIWPISSTIEEDTIKIDKTIDLEAHIVTIDNVLKKYDQYCITYHANSKWNLNRIGVVDYLFRVTDKNGKILDDNEKSKSFYNTFIGAQGEKWFEIPEDNIIYLSFTNGKIIELDIKEYQYE